MAPKLGVEYDEAAVDYLIEKHYRAVNRPFRCCQPRDLLLQVRNYCRYTNKPAEDDAGELRLRGRELLRGDVRTVAGLYEAACTHHTTLHSISHTHTHNSP